MRLWFKATLFLLMFLLGPFAFQALLHGRISNEAIGGIGVGWFLLFATAQFLVIRCPRCHHCAFITPSGRSVPWVGKNCRHCGTPY